MTQGTPPSPTAFASLDEWARRFYEFYLAETRLGQQNDPLPVLLAHQTSSETYRATTDGVLMYDPVKQQVVVSKDGQFVPVLLEDDVYISQFNELVTTSLTPLIELNAAYGVSVKRDVVTTTNSATVARVGGEIELATSATANSMALLETAEAGRYIPGFAAQIGTGMRIPTAPSGNELFEWGGVDAINGPNSGSENGFWFGYDATGVYVARATGGTVTKAYQSSWNLDKFDGSGGKANPSKLTLDMSKGYIFRIVFTYYGHGPIVYEIVETNRFGRQKPISVHFDRVDGAVSVENPSLYLFQKSDNGGDASAISCYVGGRSYGIFGTYRPALRATTQVSATAVATSTTRVPLITFRRKLTDLDKSVKPLDYNTIATDEDTIVEVVLNGSLTGASYGTPDGVSASETALEVDTSATAISGGEVIFSTLIPANKDKSGNLGQSGAALSDLEIPRDQPFTLCARTLTGTGTATGTLSAKEEW